MMKEFELENLPGMLNVGGFDWSGRCYTYPAGQLLIVRGGLGNLLRIGSGKFVHQTGKATKVKIIIFSSLKGPYQVRETFHMLKIFACLVIISMSKKEILQT